MQGWLPKPGAQFGGHFVLYRSHPEVDHAEYVVRCMQGRPPAAQPLPLLPPDGPVTDGAVAPRQELAPSEASPVVGNRAGQHFAWPELLAALRVAGQVRKRLLLLYVHFPAENVQHEAPGCLEAASVRPCYSHACAVCPSYHVQLSLAGCTEWLRLKWRFPIEQGHYIPWYIQLFTW